MGMLCLHGTSVPTGPQKKKVRQCELNAGFRRYVLFDRPRPALVVDGDESKDGIGNLDAASISFLSTLRFKETAKVPLEIA